MITILRMLADHCGFLFAPGGFRFVDSSVEQSFGNALVVLESKTTRIRITLDRSQLACEFQPVQGPPGRWYSLGPLRGVIQGDRGGSEVFDESWASFLKSSIDYLDRAFADRQTAEKLLQGLKEQERLRAKELFG